MLKFLLDRILPRDRCIHLALPELDFADDAVDAMAVVSRAIGEEQISPNEGSALSSIVTASVRAIEVWDLSRRIETIEASLNPKAGE
jgi:hypothetical protein